MVLLFINGSTIFKIKNMYKVKEGKEGVVIGSKIYDGTTQINKKLSECTQKELEALHSEIGLTTHIEKLSDEAPTKKKRNNRKGKESRLDDFTEQKQSEDN